MSWQVTIEIDEVDDNGAPVGNLDSHMVGVFVDEGYAGDVWNAVVSLITDAGYEPEGG